MDHSLDDSHILQAVRDDFLDFTATLIQSSYRGYQLRKSYNVLVCTSFCTSVAKPTLVPVLMFLKDRRMWEVHIMVF